MRIVYDAAPLLNPLTGVGHYALTLLDEMLAQDAEIEFELIALTVRADTSRIPNDPRVNLRHYRIPARWAVKGWEAVQFPKGESLFGASTAVHGTNFWVPPLSNPNGIVTIHDITFHLYPELCTPQVQRYRWIVPKVLKRCALVLTPSEVVRQQVASELSFPEDRIIVTPEGIRGAFIEARRDAELERRLGIKGDYLLFAGTQEPRKNLDRLIQAFALIEEPIQLVIAGPPGWGSVDLQAVSHKFHLDGRVIFSGYLPDVQLGSLFAGCKTFAFPTLYEGFGLPPLEAMAAGIPVVAASTGSLPEVLGDAPFYCDPLDVHSIAAALNESLTDHAARASAIEAGRTRAAMFSWKETARLTLRAYRSL
ncbi:MAG TPA: glycosyltransferase family 1 protein [Actinomycetota bacterium]|nr:glycosyltransferase family 1 protein [Actinomycetota bacterium]